MPHYKITLQNTPITYELIHSQRKTVGIIVRRDASLVIRAPKRIPMSEVEAILHLRADWILHKLAQRHAHVVQSPPREYRHGEMHPYLGEPHALHVIPVKNRQRVERTSDSISVYTRQPDYPQHTRALLKAWYKSEAERFFPQRLQAILPRFDAHTLPPFTLRVRDLKSRWGSCSTRGSITLNQKLMQVPQACMDYVIIHELCHLIEANHSKRFYALQASILPDWREHKHQLNHSDVVWE